MNPIIERERETLVCWVTNWTGQPLGRILIPNHVQLKKKKKNQSNVLNIYLLI